MYQILLKGLFTGTFIKISKHRSLFARHFGKLSESNRCMKVAVCGASGAVGQPLSLLLKQCPYVGELALYDTTGTCGVGLELSHIDTTCRVKAYSGQDYLSDSLKGSTVVVISGISEGSQVKSGPSADDLFLSNAKTTQEISAVCTEVCPEALLAIIATPINSMVPVAVETFKKFGRYNNSKIFGVTTLDSVRANTFAAQALGSNPECVVVPVIGGHSDTTTIPVLSQTRPTADLKSEEMARLTAAIQNAETDAAKAGSTSLSTAFAAARFIISLLKGVLGHKDVVECAYIHSDCIEGVTYFATPLQLGHSGMMKNLGVPPLSELECGLLRDAIPHLQEDILKGERFVRCLDCDELLVHN